MFSAVKAVRGLQNRVSVRGVQVVHRPGSQRSVRRVANARFVPALSTHHDGGGQCRRKHTTTSTGQDDRGGKEALKDVPPGAEDIKLHEKFLTCVEKQEVSGAIAHFATIACTGSPLLPLRRRQLLVMLCAKGLVMESSDLLTNATVSSDFDGQDPATTAAFMYVIHACLQHGELDRAAEHFRQAAERGVGLDLPLCEDLAGSLFLAGLGEDAADAVGKETIAWDVLKYVRRRGMFHGSHVVCDPPLMRAVETENLQFAVRMCDYMDREGLRPDSETLQKLHEVTVSSMQQDSSLPAAEMLGMVLEGWAESEFGLDSDEEGDEQIEDESDEDDRRQAADTETGFGQDSDSSASRLGVGDRYLGKSRVEDGATDDMVFVDLADAEEREGSDGVVAGDDVGNSEGFVLDDGELPMTHDEVVRVTNGRYSETEASQSGSIAWGSYGDESRYVPSSPLGVYAGAMTAAGEDARERTPGEAEEAVDWGSSEFRGDLLTQLRALHPDMMVSFALREDGRNVFGYGGQPGDVRRDGGSFGGPGYRRKRDEDGTAVFYVHLPFEHGDEGDEDQQGVVTIRLLLRGNNDEESMLRDLLRGDEDDDEDDDDDDDLDP